MVPIADYHIFKVVQSLFLPFPAPYMLPTRKFFENQKAKLIAGIEKMGRLRIMTCAHDYAPQFFFEYLGIAPLAIWAHGITDIWIFLVPI